MIPAVRTALNNVLGSAATLRNAGGAGRAFELFVMTGIARELKARGFNVWLQRSDETRVKPSDPNRTFIQRGGSPTGLAGKSQGANNASVIGFQFPGRQAWEIWNGIQFEGRSGALHELDLAIVPASVGTALRQQTFGGSPTGRPRVAIECKDVRSAGSVDEMRAFVARLYDLSLLSGHHRYLPFGSSTAAIHPGAPASAAHQSVVTYWQENRRTLNIVARRTGFVLGASAMTGYHAVEPHGGIVLGSPNVSALIDAVATWISNQCY